MAALSEQDLKALRLQLKALKAELEALLDLSEAAADTVDLDQSKVGRLSRMDALQQQAMAQANQAQHKARLGHVARALAAIADGDYGYCADCGDEIDIARLKARPESSLCINCQEKLETG